MVFNKRMTNVYVALLYQPFIILVHVCISLPTHHNYLYHQTCQIIEVKNQFQNNNVLNLMAQ